MNYDDDRDWDYDDMYGDGIHTPLADGTFFAKPGSALRAETPDNPRIHPCPNCGAQNVLTTADVAHGYQCDRCADAVERGVDGY